MMLTAPDGTEREFHVDLDAIIEMENRPGNESWTISDVLGNQKEGALRISALDAICRIFGTTYKAFVAMGFSVNDLMVLVSDPQMFAELGFPLPPASEQAETPSDVASATF